MEAIRTACRQARAVFISLCGCPKNTRPMQLLAGELGRGVMH